LILTLNFFLYLSFLPVFYYFAANLGVNVPAPFLTFVFANRICRTGKSIHRKILKCKNNRYHQYFAGFGIIGDDHTDSLYGEWFIELFEGKYEFQRDAFLRCDRCTNQHYPENMDAQPFVKSSRFISKQEAKEQLIKDLGEDPEELLGYNPAQDCIEIFCMPNMPITTASK